MIKCNSYQSVSASLTQAMVLVWWVWSPGRKGTCSLVQASTAAAQEPDFKNPSPEQARQSYPGHSGQLRTSGLGHSVKTLCDRRGGPRNRLRLRCSLGHNRDAQLMCFWDRNEPIFMPWFLKASPFSLSEWHENLEERNC